MNIRLLFLQIKKEYRKKRQIKTILLKKFKVFQMKYNFIIKLEIPLSAFIASDDDHYRKPCLGMWNLFL